MPAAGKPCLRQASVTVGGKVEARTGEGVRLIRFDRKQGVYFATGRYVS